MNKRQFKMNIEEFKANLGLYGSDLNVWPEDIKSEAISALKTQTDLQKLVDEEKQFEETLNFRNLEEPSPGLESRIISAAKKQPLEPSSSKSLFVYIREVFQTFHLPSPAYALSVMLLIGIALGYFSSNSTSLANDDTEIEEISFYEGDLYE